MSIKIVKITEELMVGESGSAITHRLARMIDQAQRRVKRESGILLPAGRAYVTVEQEYEDGK